MSGGLHDTPTGADPLSVVGGHTTPRVPAQTNDSEVSSLSSPVKGGSSDATNAATRLYIAQHVFEHEGTLWRFIRKTEATHVAA